MRCGRCALPRMDGQGSRVGRRDQDRAPDDRGGSCVFDARRFDAGWRPGSRIWKVSATLRHSACRCAALRRSGHWGSIAGRQLVSKAMSADVVAMTHRRLHPRKRRRAGRTMLPAIVDHWKQIPSAEQRDRLFIERACPLLVAAGQVYCPPYHRGIARQGGNLRSLGGSCRLLHRRSGDLAGIASRAEGWLRQQSEGRWFVVEPRSAVPPQVQLWGRRKLSGNSLALASR